MSNATSVVPLCTDLMCEFLFEGEITQFVQTEKLVLNEQTKEEISEILDVLYGILEKDIDSFTMEEKEEALDKLMQLKDNSILGTENYEAILNYIK